MSLIHARRIPALGATVVLVLIASASAYGGLDPNGSSGTSAGSGKAKCTFGVVRFDGTDPFSNASTDGTAQYAKSIGCKATIVDAQGSVDKANSAITNLAVSGATAIAIGVFPTSALKAGVAAARAKKIPVASWGGGVGPGVSFAASIGQGAGISKRLVRDLGGRGSVLDLGYRPGLPCQQRETAFLAAVKGTRIKVTKQQITIPGQVTSAQQATLAWAASHPAGKEPLAVWACFDDPASGAVAALRSLGRTDVKVYGINGTSTAIALIKAGQMTATTWIDGKDQGIRLGKLLWKAAKEGPPAKPVTIGAKTIIVDKANVDAFLKAHPGLAK
ncbi:MAG: ribose transport system substrate-binding protein [Solirubrobacterales bacterium]|nr:ribose transport system substrate-binding protein [Solirubrobacterales bacterium]